MKVHRITACGTAGIENWLARLERKVTQGLARRKPVQWLHQWLNTRAASKTEVTSLGANLLSLQTEMRRQTKAGCWIVVVL